PSFDSCFGDGAIDRPLSPLPARAASVPDAVTGQFPIGNIPSRQPPAGSFKKAFDRSRRKVLRTPQTGPFAGPPAGLGTGIRSPRTGKTPEQMPPLTKRARRALRRRAWAGLRAVTSVLPAAWLRRAEPHA